MMIAFAFGWLGFAVIGASWLWSREHSRSASAR